MTEWLFFGTGCNVRGLLNCNDAVKFLESVMKFTEVQDNPPESRGFQASIKNGSQSTIHIFFCDQVILELIHCRTRPK